MFRPINLMPRLHQIVIGIVCAIAIGIVPTIADEDTSLLSVWSGAKFGTTPTKIFRRLDDNGDNKVEEYELVLHKLSLFAERDTNRDDVLSRNELPLVKDSVFAEIDANKDGKISGYEFSEAKIGEFANMDSDKNGYITMEEFANFVRSIRAK